MKQLVGKAILVGGAFALAACQTVEPGSPEASAHTQRLSLRVQFDAAYICARLHICSCMYIGSMQHIYAHPYIYAPVCI